MLLRRILWVVPCLVNKHGIFALFLLCTTNTKSSEHVSDSSQPLRVNKCDFQYAPKHHIWTQPFLGAWTCVVCVNMSDTMHAFVYTYNDYRMEHSVLLLLLYDSVVIIGSYIIWP